MLPNRLLASFKYRQWKKHAGLPRDNGDRKTACRVGGKYLAGENIDDGHVGAISCRRRREVVYPGWCRGTMVGKHRDHRRLCDHGRMGVTLVPRHAGAVACNSLGASSSEIESLEHVVVRSRGAIPVQPDSLTVHRVRPTCETLVSETCALCVWHQHVQGLGIRSGIRLR
jgi:hypothetical protein